MKKTYDVPSYPQLGKVYPGDYYEDLPFDAYVDRAQALPEGEHVFDIRDFGALPEKYLLNTQAFAAAAKACEEAGGGTILVAGGSYWTGTIFIPSHTTLFVAADAEIVASRNVENMTAPAGAPNGHGGSCLVAVTHADHVTITGGGRISGSGEWYVYEPRELPSLEPFPITALPRRDQAREINNVPGTLRYAYRQRIRYDSDRYGEGNPPLRRPGFLVLVRESSNIRIENIVLHASMAWTLNLECSRNIQVRNVVIDDNRHVANTDGIDVTGSSNVQIEHCFVSCADDGIVLKNPEHTCRPMSNIHVKDCTVITVMSAFKIGTETGHDISNVLVENCRFCMPDLFPGSVSGISLESCDGTNLSDVVIRNITMDQVCAPLYICLNMRNRYGDPYTDQVGANRYWGGSIRRITIEHIQATGAEVPSIITGFETGKINGEVVRRPVRDIVVRNFHATYRDNPAYIHVPPYIPELLYDYPESNAHGDVDASGLWVRHADGFTLEQIDIAPRSCDRREIIRLHDVTSVTR